MALKDAKYWIDRYGGEDKISEKHRATIVASLNSKLMLRLSSDLMRDLDLRSLNGGDDFNHSVFALTPGHPNRISRLALSIGDNFHLDELPSDEILAKIKAAFQFECEPGWFMDALDYRWVRYW